MPDFQHRQYAAIAKVISELPEENEMRLIVARSFDTMFAGDNPRYDRDRFFAAAKGKPSHKKDAR